MPSAKGSSWCTGTGRARVGHRVRCLGKRARAQRKPCLDTFSDENPAAFKLAYKVTCSVSRIGTLRFPMRVIVFDIAP